MTKKRRLRIILASLFFLCAAYIGLLIFLVTVTPIDRPFFLSKKSETIVVEYHPILCNCPRFSEVNNSILKPDSREKRELFYVEAAKPELEISSSYFDEERFQYNLKLTGSYYFVKGIPAEFKIGHNEDKPERARVFRYRKIELVEK